MKIKPLVAALAVALFGCDDPVAVSQRTTDDCHRLTLRDGDTDSPVRGAEDLVQSPDQNFLIVSAYDRWAAEQAARSGAASIPRGALYRLPHLEKRFEADEYVASPLSAAGFEDLDLRPHGLDLYVSEAGATLAVINRRYVAAGTPRDLDWQVETTLELFDLENANLNHRRTIRSDLLCRANNVAVLSATEFLVTRDHGACEGLGVTVEDVFGLARGKLLHIATEPTKPYEETISVVAENLAFPNGIAVDRAKGWVYVATTRDQSIKIYAANALTDGKITEPESRIALPASPDNLTLTATGELIVAAHPSLLRLGFYRNQWFGVTDAPSQIYSVNATTKEIALLFDDPSGLMISAATVAAQSENYLTAGSVADAGLLVCKPESRMNS